ncbi:biopolymer transporter ExbD [Luteolibacter ambystomatis]|uniref:Biopolymer transporter ExbD n=1 Tax=Luteolibacter ambystomatis TaxID=2824561 RepID=A0A975PGN6_9BACT|nr:biopolymer transporter ExbD [Luteolibacter ambystomatis]QUE52913.1 biopolymer transporter ExbD [Luteolibacter ambystomatis]
MKFSSQQPLGPAPLQLASMIDIMLVLLMFFILSYQFAAEERSLEVAVPTVADGAQHNQQRGEILINVKADGTVIVERKNLTRPELTERLTAVSKIYKNQPVRLRGDANCSYQTIVEIIDLCQKAGIWNISFATQLPPKPEN